MRISDWSSDVCSSDLSCITSPSTGARTGTSNGRTRCGTRPTGPATWTSATCRRSRTKPNPTNRPACASQTPARSDRYKPRNRSEEHTSELQSLMRISYAVFCLKKKTHTHHHTTTPPHTPTHTPQPIPTPTLHTTHTH